MTTEDDFQAALDAHPDDFQTRLVFADWLQERDDPRAEGYRALGKPGCYPNCYTLKGTSTRHKPAAAAWWAYWTDPHPRFPALPHHEGDWLPFDWFRLIPKLPEEVSVNCHLIRATRRELDDVVALAFALLPAERRAELLAESVSIGGVT